MWVAGTAAAIGRSFDSYFRDAGRWARMQALLGRFVSEGSLAFDIGAHVGDRTACLRRLGARVVALEPQPAPFRALRLLFGGADGIELARTAAGARCGSARMLINSANPTVSTLSGDFVAAAGEGPGWGGQVWDGGRRVDVTTLDALIRRHGPPDFVKIDVEGHEAEVLAGLTRPVPALSFEVTSLGRQTALDCLDRLDALGPYRFDLSLGETHRLRHGAWISGDILREDIRTLTHRDNSGDVYAVLEGRHPA
jgi:FkbM family methyltransferase